MGHIQEKNTANSDKNQNFRRKTKRSTMRKNKKTI